MTEEDDLQRALREASEAALKLVAENEEAQRQFIWAQQNRLGLLWVHAGIGFIVGTAMLVYGTAYNIEQEFGLWTRTFFALLGIGGGGILAWGLTRKPVRSIPAEALGLVLLAVWDILIAGAFVTVVAASPPDPAWPWEEIPQTAARLYPVGVYLGIFALLGLHVYTLRGLLSLRRP